MRFKFKTKLNKHPIVVECSSKEKAIEIFKGVIPSDKQHLFKLQNN